jgi:hypothetical protein
VFSVSLKIDTIEYHVGKNFFVKEGLTPNEIHFKFIIFYENSSSVSTIKKGAAKFKRGRISLKFVQVKSVQKVQQHE